MRNIDDWFKIKVGILLFLVIFGYFFGISAINSNIRDLRHKRDDIKNINININLINSISTRIYVLDDRIMSNLITEKDFIREYNQITILKDGLRIFSKEENNNLDSLISLNLDNIRQYSKDSIKCSTLAVYYKKKIIISSQIKRSLNLLVQKYIDSNNKKLQEVLDSYEKSYFEYIIVGSSVVVVLTLIGIMLIMDMITLVRSNYRTNSTIDGLIRYMKSKRSEDLNDD